jgi:hypothetical protein
MMALLHDWEHMAGAFNLGNNEDNCFVVPASFVVTADHNPRRDEEDLWVRGFVGQGRRWSAITLY